MHETALVFDASVFQELLEALAGDLDRVASIYQTFFETATFLIGSLLDQDCATQAKTLHTLKGSAAMVGGERMARLVTHLQQIAANSVHPIIRTRIEELSGELVMLRGAVNAYARSCSYAFEI